MIAWSILIHGGSVSIAARANNPYAVFVIRLRTGLAKDYVTVQWGSIIENVRSIVKRIFSRGIIGTDLLIITSVTGNKRNAEWR